MSLHSRNSTDDWPTFLPEIHLHLEHLEVVRDAGLDLAPHPLSRPLLEAAEFFVDIHDDDDPV